MKRRIKCAAEIRLVFPPSTELVSLYYLGGDGQEALPAGTLPQPLRAGVSNERWPVEGAQVRFLIVERIGTLTGSGSSGNDITIPTGADGVASVNWQLDDVTKSQRVEATLLDGAGYVRAGVDRL